MPQWLPMLVIVACVVVLAAIGLGERLIEPARQGIGSPPAGLNACAVVLHCANGLRIDGWLCRGKAGAGAVLLVHGVRANRLVMLDRAHFLDRLGYTVLLIDLPAHGESGGKHITYGLDEAQAVRSALDFLARELPDEKVAVIAVSLGAAAVVLSQPSPAPSALVLESMFPTIRDALANRLQAILGSWGRLLAPLVLWWFGLRLGIAPALLEPISKMRAIHAPVLIASGLADRYTTATETERIYEAANAPKSLWLVPGAGHVDLHAHDPQRYERLVSRFLEDHLRGRD